MNFTLHFPKQILFGCGKLKELSQQTLPGQRAMVVISCGKSARKNGSLDLVLSQLEAAGVSTVVYDGIEANPNWDSIDRGGALCRENGCDFVVALGGGSVIDSGKMIAILGTNPGSIWDYVSTGTGGNRPIAVKPLPLVAIPTTSGTGSEVDFGASFSRLETGEKVTVKDPCLTPVLTVIDPLLTLHMPSHFMAYQGWDALTHSIEYLLNREENVMCDMFAREAVRYAGEALADAVNTADEAAHEKMALASFLSGFAIGHGGVTSQHALECAISGLYPELPHGAGLLLLSKAFFRFFIDKHVCDDVFVELARLLGDAEAASPDAFLDAIARIQRDCHVDTLKMSDFGIDPARFPEIIRNARISMGGGFQADRYALSDEDCLQILEESYS